MTNERLLARILEACDRFERRELSVADLQASLEANASALEGVDNSVYSKLREFSNALERIRFACLLEKQHDETLTVIRELREYLSNRLL